MVLDPVFHHSMNFIQLCLYKGVAHDSWLTFMFIGMFRFLTIVVLLSSVSILSILLCYGTYYWQNCFLLWFSLFNIVTFTDVVPLWLLIVLYFLLLTTFRETVMIFFPWFFEANFHCFAYCSLRRIKHIHMIWKSRWEVQFFHKVRNVPYFAY